MTSIHMCTHTILNTGLVVRRILIDSQDRCVRLTCRVNQHLIFADYRKIIFNYEIYYSYRTMEYEFMLKILILITGKFSTLIGNSARRAATHHQ